ncbi:hypothetical protein SDC9_199581 [bioreactor metagenome]|uniref:Uncharacterized protein n=1 Tax=bioreactor metagenome TaxID=1076179 RepID=A0A645ILF4_9ZZZZ
MQCKEDTQEQRQDCYRKSRLFCEQRRDLFPFHHQPDCSCQQQQVLIKGLPVADDKCIAKTAAIFYRVGNGHPQCERREEDHKEQDQPGCPLPVNTQQQKSTQRKFGCHHKYCGR